MYVYGRMFNLPVLGTMGRGLSMKHPLKIRPTASSPLIRPSLRWTAHLGQSCVR